MLIYAKIVIALTGLMHAGFGLAYLLAPAKMGSLTKFDLAEPIARTEIRAFYGGLEIGLAVLLLACAVRADWLGVGLWAVVLTAGCTAAGRVFGLVVDHSAGGMLLKILAVEIAVTLAGAAGLVWKSEAA